MQVAQVQDGEPIELIREPFRQNLVVAQSHSRRISAPTPVGARQTQNHSDDSVGYRQILNVKKGQSLAEGTRFMVLFYTDPLTCMDASQATFERTINFPDA
jgi:hypothetical protein